MTEVILPKVVTEASAESPRGTEMEAGVNEDMGEMAERKALHGDGKYDPITERDTKIMAHEGAGPISKIGTPSTYYEGDQLQCRRVRSFQSTSAGQFQEEMLSELRIQVKIQIKKPMDEPLTRPIRGPSWNPCGGPFSMQIHDITNTHTKNHNKGNHIDSK